MVQGRYQWGIFPPAPQDIKTSVDDDSIPATIQPPTVLAQWSSAPEGRPCQDPTHQGIKVRCYLYSMTQQKPWPKSKHTTPGLKRQVSLGFICWSPAQPKTTEKQRRISIRELEEQRMDSGSSTNFFSTQLLDVNNTAYPGSQMLGPPLTVPHHCCK